VLIEKYITCGTPILFTTIYGVRLSSSCMNRVAKLLNSYTG
jgi:hypothetical protein